MSDRDNTQKNNTQNRDNAQNQNRDLNNDQNRSTSDRSTSERSMAGNSSENSSEGSNNWNQFKRKIRGAWNNLTDEEIDSFRGDQESLSNSIQKKTGKSREDVNSKLDQYRTETSYSFDGDSQNADSEMQYKKAK